MAWLTGYTYRKKGAVNATTAGAQTNYQLKLVVGESSGASGEDVDCESHCIDFPNDLRFTKEDGETKHDYWVESITGTTPNRLATIRIEIASIPASGSVDFYMYYGNNEATQYEDFTTFTEVDVASDRIQKTAYHIDHLSYRNETTYLYKDYSAAHFDDFTHKIKVRFVSSSVAWAGGHSWLLANDVAGAAWMENNNKTYLSIFLLSDGSNNPRIWLREMYNGSYYDDTYVCSFNTWYYVKIVKSGTSINAYVYSDSDYSNLLDTLTLTLHANHTLRYLYGCNSDNDGGNKNGVLDIENFDIGVESESAGGDTFEFFDDFEYPETLQIIKTTKENVHLSTDYCMDPNMCLLHDGTWFVVFREGSVHTYSSSGKARFVKSINNGGSWSSPSTIYDTANKDDRQPNVSEFQEGGVWTILVAWTVTTANPIDDNCESVKVIKSTNGGTSWGTPVTVTTGDDMRVTGNPIQMANGNILLPLTAYVTGKKRNKVAISDDDGVNWTIYNASNHYTDGRCNELAVVEYEAGKLLGIARNQAGSYFNKITSANYGVTWTAPVLTNVPSPKDRPHLILLQSGDIALTYAHTDDDYRIVLSSDKGVTWGVDDYCSVYYESGIAAFSGYPASIEYEENKVFSIFEIQASSSDEDIYGNKINIVDVKWDVEGAISVSNGVVHLDNDDWITGKTAFGNGYCYETRAKANEQDTCFIVACQTHNVWNDDIIIIGNSDLYPNDFDRFFLDFWKAGSQNTVSLDNWNDFRSVYYHYCIKKISNSKVIMEQELNSSTYTNSTYITTENLKLALRVWDSSQESQLDVDFALVRKYADPEPTWGSWGAAEVETKTDSDTGSGADAKAALDAVIPSEYILDPMDATTGWQAQAGMTNITVNTTTKKEGTGALNLIKGANDDTDAYIEKAISSTDLTSKYVKVWLYLKDTATVNKISQAQIYLYDASSNYRAWDIADLAIGWNLIIADTDSTPDHQSGTPGNLAAITKIELDVDTNQATDTYAEGDVIADYYHYSGFDISDTGSGVESIGTRVFTTLEEGSGTESVLELLASRSDADMGTGADVKSSLLKANAKSSGDSGTGVDILASLSKVITPSDVGSGTESLGSRSFSASDVGTGIDEISAITSERDITASEVGTGAEALSSRSFFAADSGIGVDTFPGFINYAELRGFYYAKIGNVIFRNLNKDSFRITEELNKIPSFEFEISNSAANRAAITAGITDILRIFHRHDGSDTLMFTGIINGDAIEYLSLERIRLVGYASYIDLNWRFHQHLNSEDAESVDKCYVYHGSYTDKTTAANNDAINDVTITYSSANDALYIGQGEQFFGMQVKYSTKGVQAANTTVVWEYSEGSSVWSTLDVLDETRQFTQDVGTYYITIPHKPSDWAKEMVNSVKKFWIRARLTAGSYSTQPKLDRIKITNVDVYRVYYFDTAANTIMDEVLDGTGYSLDVTDACPSDTISIVAEYETKLRMIAGVANALTWDDSGDKKAYQWWVDTSKKVHFKQKRGSTLGDITKELTILNNVQDYFNLSNRLHFLGNYDGLNQLRAVIENTTSQDTHEIRELAVPEERYNNYIPLKEAAQKAMSYTKAPLQKIAATVTTKYWLDEGFEVGDTVTLHHDRWNVDETAFQIVRADIGPRVTNLDMGISQEHLDGLKAGLQRQLDISGIRMHGSTSLLQFGPETMNYHRVDATTVYPARLKIEVPSDARYIHKVLLSWTIGNFRADVGPTTGTGGGHDHTGYAGAGGEHDHTGFAGSGGAFTPEVMDAGVHTPVSLSSAHVHEVHGTIPYETDGQWGYLTVSEWSDYESVHTHSNPYTGMEPNHSHSFSDTSGGPSGTTSACVSIGYGTSCTSGSCVDPSSTYFQDVASAGHTHYVSGTTGSDGGHDHSIGSTGAGSSHRHRIGYAAQYDHYITDITFGTGTLWTSELEDPAHIHDMVEVPDHSTPGVYHGPHTDHGIVQQAAHSNHVIFQAVDFALDVLYQIYEVAAGTVMELIVNGETVGSNYEGAQTDIRIDGYMQTGTNTVEIQPIATEVDKKGGATMKGDGILFIEPKKF
jgi:hypothetical protein